MKKINKGKVLILTDLHQSIGEYAEKVLEMETDWDYIIINGDMIDTFKVPDGKHVYGVTETCKWINQKMEEWGDRAIWHVGNHDISYISSYTKDYTKTKPNPYYYCSGWTRNKAKYFNKTINPEWFDKLKLCTLLGEDLVISHAGFHYRHFQPHMSEIDNIERLYNEWERDKYSFYLEPLHWIWDVGRSRGGMAIVGSPVWQDWEEFVPLDNVCQIFGHSTDPKGARCKKNGDGLENWCIDGCQTCYAIWGNNNLVIKYIN